MPGGDQPYILDEPSQRERERSLVVRNAMAEMRTRSSSRTSPVSSAKLTPSWARFVVGARKEIVVALDWTDFERDDHHPSPPSARSNLLLWTERARLDESNVPKQHQAHAAHTSNLEQ